MLRIVMLSLLAVFTSAHSQCEYNLMKELEEERREDSYLHECRACRTIELDAGWNCPREGYNCQESLPMTSHVLRTDDCSCAQLRCRDSNASIAVEGAIVGRLRCKNRKWMAGSEEATSAVCAVRKQAMPVCQSCARDLITKTTTGAGSHGFKSDTVDPSGKCAVRTLTCEGENANIEINNKGGVIQDVDDGKKDGVARIEVTCDASGKQWMHRGAAITQLECASSKDGPVCQSCARDLITTTTTGAGSHGFKSDTVDPSGKCAVRTLTCEGENANIEINAGSGVISDGDDGKKDGVARISLNCDAGGAAWTLAGTAVTQLECASGV